MEPKCVHFSLWRVFLASQMIGLPCAHQQFGVSTAIQRPLVNVGGADEDDGIINDCHF